MSVLEFCFIGTHAVSQSLVTCVAFHLSEESIKAQYCRARAHASKATALICDDRAAATNGKCFVCASERSIKLIWFGRLVDLRSGASLVISPADDKSGVFI